MKAAIIEEYGDSQLFKIKNDYPTPSVLPNQVLIKVHATSVNPLDINIRKGLLKHIFRNKVPLVLGNDLSGTIVECGEKISNFKIGDEVYCMSDADEIPSKSGFAKPGAYAEFAVTREDTLSLKPKNLKHEEAAAIPLCSLTAYQALIELGRIESGDKVLINGASGGVGVFAVMIAKSYGAKITAVCSTKNVQKLKDLKVDKVINYTKENPLNTYEKFDIIYDVASKLKYKQCSKNLSEKGLYISNIAPIMVFLLPFLRRFRKINKFAFTWVEPIGKKLDKISNIIMKQEMSVLIDKIYSLEEIANAHYYCENGKPFGKVVIQL